MDADSRSHGLNLLICGAPGIGKTTIALNLAARLARFRPAGFYTREIRQSGRRVGFSVETLSGQCCTLAHVDIKSDLKVSRYAVDVRPFERCVLPALSQPAQLYVIDEIGKMECFSDAFTAAVRALLDGDGLVVATVAVAGGGFITEVKRRSDVRLLEVTRANRDALIDEIDLRISTQLAGT